MKLTLLNTSSGLVPLDDRSYEGKKKLKTGEKYTAEIRLCRNYEFHKLYFALIKCAWECLPERMSSGFRSEYNFRKYVEVAAGHCEPFYSPTKGEWFEVPKSISFESMDEIAFRELYERVKDVILSILEDYITKGEFERILLNF